MKIRHQQNIQSFWICIGTANIRCYDEQSIKSVQSALSDLLTTSATHGTFSRPSTKRGLISIIKLMQFTIDSPFLLGKFGRSFVSESVPLRCC